MSLHSHFSLSIWALKLAKNHGENILIRTIRVNSAALAIGNGQKPSQKYFDKNN